MSLKIYCMQKGAPWATFSDWPDTDYITCADHASLQAKAGALAEALERTAYNLKALHPDHPSHQQATQALAAYRGDK